MQRMKPDDHPIVSAKELKDVIAFGKKCSKHAFPNPTRTDCPERARLRAMAQRNPNLTLDDLPLTHVVRCSPCFQDYLHFRRMSLFVRGLQITAASLVVATAFITAVLIVRHRPSNHGESSLSQQKKLRPTPSSGDPASQSSVPVPPLEMRIDLAAFSPTRGVENDAPREAIHLPRRTLRVTFQMPLGMEAGDYGFRLTDASGSVYSDTRAPGHVSGGTTSVDMDVDLRSAPRGEATLMIRPPGLSWRSFPAIIE
jgi:hypothetical protein